MLVCDVGISTQNKISESDAKQKLLMALRIVEVTGNYIYFSSSSKIELSLVYWHLIYEFYYDTIVREGGGRLTELDPLISQTLFEVQSKKKFIPGGYQRMKSS